MNNIFYKINQNYDDMMIEFTETSLCDDNDCALIAPVNEINYKYTNINYDSLTNQQKEFLIEEIQKEFSILLTTESDNLTVELSKGSVVVDIQINGNVDRPSDDKIRSAGVSAAANAGFDADVDDILVCPLEIRWEPVTNNDGNYSTVTLQNGQVTTLNKPLNSFKVFEIGGTTYFMAGVVNVANYGALAGKVIYSTDNGKNWYENNGAIEGSEYPVSAYDWVYLNGILYCAAENGIFWATSPENIFRKVQYNLDGIDQTNNFVYRLGYNDSGNGYLFVVRGSRIHKDSIIRIDLSGGISDNNSILVYETGSGIFKQFINNGNDIYALLDENNEGGNVNRGGIYKSIDNGLTWNQLQEIDNAQSMIINPNNNYMYIGLYDKIGRLNLITGEFNILYITEGIPSTYVTTFLSIVGNDVFCLLAGSSYPYSLELNEDNGIAFRQSDGLPQSSIGYFGVGSEGKIYTILNFTGTIFYRQIRN